MLAGRTSDPGAVGGRGDARRSCRPRRPGTRARCSNAAPPPSMPEGPRLPARRRCATTHVVLRADESDRAAARRSRSPITALHENAKPDPSHRARRAARHLGLPVRGGQRARGAGQRHALEPGRALHGQARRRGARRATARSRICGTRDPMLIGRLDDFLGRVREKVDDQGARRSASTPEQYRLVIRTYGGDGVMGAREPVRRRTPHELGFVVEVVARDARRSPTRCWRSRATNMLHVDFPGPPVQGRQHGVSVLALRHRDRAPAYRFCVFHTVGDSTIRCELVPHRIRDDLSHGRCIRDIASGLQEQERRPVRADDRRRVRRRRACSSACSATGVLGPALFARLYHVRRRTCCSPRTPPAIAFKATIPRLVPSGDFGDTDVYGAQQHAPLLDVDIPICAIFPCRQGKYREKITPENGARRKPVCSQAFTNIDRHALREPEGASRESRITSGPSHPAPDDMLRSWRR